MLKSLYHVVTLLISPPLSSWSLLALTHLPLYLPLHSYTSPCHNATLYLASNLYPLRGASVCPDNRFALQHTLQLRPHTIYISLQSNLHHTQIYNLHATNISYCSTSHPNNLYHMCSSSTLVLQHEYYSYYAIIPPI